MSMIEDVRKRLPAIPRINGNITNKSHISCKRWPMMISTSISLGWLPSENHHAGRCEELRAKWKIQ